MTFTEWAFILIEIFYFLFLIDKRAFLCFWLFLDYSLFSNYRFSLYLLYWLNLNVLSLRYILDWCRFFRDNLSLLFRRFFMDLFSQDIIQSFRFISQSFKVLLSLFICQLSLSQDGSLDGDTGVVSMNDVDSSQHAKNITQKAYFILSHTINFIL